MPATLTLLAPLEADWLAEAEEELLDPEEPLVPEAVATEVLVEVVPFA